MNSSKLNQFLALAAGVILLSGCAGSPQKGIGKLTQIKSAASIDAARGLGMKLWKFEYTLTPGKYHIDVWLEQLDTGTTISDKLTDGKASTDKITDGGNIVIGLSDPATTRSEDNLVWRVGVSREETTDAKRSMSSDATHLIKNPFLDVPGDPGGPQMHSSVEKKDLELNKEITLIEWAAGTPMMHTNGAYRNARTVYLKMKIMPHGELFGD